MCLIMAVWIASTPVQLTICIHRIPYGYIIRILSLFLPRSLAKHVSEWLFIVDFNSLQYHYEPFHSYFMRFGTLRIDAIHHIRKYIYYYAFNNKNNGDRSVVSSSNKKNNFVFICVVENSYKNLMLNRLKRLWAQLHFIYLMYSNCFCVVYMDLMQSATISLHQWFLWCS